MKKIKITLLFGLTLLSKLSTATNDVDRVFTKRDTVWGEVSINLQSNLITIKKGRNRTSLPASQVRKVELSNGLSYYSGTFGEDPKYIFFEVLSDGTIPLLFREGVKFSRYDTEPFPPFFILRNNSIFSVGDKKALFEFFEEYAKEMKAFVKNERLSLKTKDDLIRVFEEYNSK